MKKILLTSLIAMATILSCTSSQKSESAAENNGTPFYNRAPAEEDNLQAWFNYAQNGGGVDAVIAETVGDKSSCGNFFQCIFQRRAKPLSDKDVAEASSTSNIRAESAELITDNNESFYAKLKAIRNAKESIRMVYYIYSNDDSSSVITQELIKQSNGVKNKNGVYTKKPVKVKLLVDLVTNYKMMDLFSYMEKAGKGNIEIRFYNFPTSRILRDAVFMTMPCPKQSDKPDSSECRDYKNNLIDSKNLTSTYFSKMLLSGLYGKSATALKLSLGLGGQISKEQFAPQAGDEPTDPEAMKEFFLLLKKAAIDNDIGAKIKLQFAMIFMGGQVKPVLDKLTGVLPVINPSKSKSSVDHGEEWDHFSDYVHHKLLAVDGKEFQLGGRNIEDSYHMNERIKIDGRAVSGKYIFKDTDFHLKTAAGGARQVEASFDKMFGFTEMVATMDQVNQYLDFEVIANSKATGYAAMKCVETAKTNLTLDIVKCTKAGMKAETDYVSQEARHKKLASDMQESAEIYFSKFPKMNSDNEPEEYFKTEFNEKLTANDLSTAEMYYLENLSFDKDAKIAKRHVGSQFNKDAKFEKNIHLMWYKQLENACYVSQKEDRDVRVIFHNAYLIMPSGMVYTLGKMMNGGFGDCSKVHVTFLTNSFNTSDLNVINILARYQMAMVFKYQKGIATKKYQRWSPRIDMYEYFSETMGAGFSLHTKLALFDKDLIVGSANLDVRSHFMDTNNAMMVRNVPNLAFEYRTYIESMLSDSKQTTRIDEHYLNYTSKKIQDEDGMILQGIIDYFLAKSNAKKVAMGLEPSPGYKFATDKRMEGAINVIHRMGTEVSFNAYKLLTFRGKKGSVEMLAESEEKDAKTRGKIKNIYNEFNNMFKLL